MVFIHTLKSRSGFGAGRYAMSALKQMSPTEDFLKLSPTARGCANEDQQFCLMRRYMDQKLQECGCIPWEFPKGSNSTKESVLFCQQEGRDCYLRVDNADNNCK